MRHRAVAVFILARKLGHDCRTLGRESDLALSLHVEKLRIWYRRRGLGKIGWMVGDIERKREERTRRIVHINKYVHEDVRAKQPFEVTS